MKVHYLFILGCFLFCPVICQADGTTPFQVSLVNPIQLHPADISVDGFRWDIIYGVNDDFQGLDLGLGNRSNGDCHGYELGLVNLVDQDFGGAQLGLFNEVGRHAKGLQAGLVNITGLSYEGLQVSVFFNNTIEEMQGLQLGLINHAGSLDGIQVGLLNFNDDTKYLGFLPFINAAF